MSALAHHSLGIPGIRRHQPVIPKPLTPRDERHLRLVWSRPEPLSQHVYRRRRLIAALVAIAFVIVAWPAARAGFDWVTAASGGSTAPTPATMVPASSTTWTVGKGDTLWSIATAVSEPGKDVRPLVAKLSTQRSGKPLQPGERIAVTPP